MSVLIAIALKSLLIAGVTMGLLALMKQRSAAERSWVAHIGLLALIIMAFAPMVLPSWTSWSVEAPAALTQQADPVQPAVAGPVTRDKIEAAVKAKVEQAKAQAEARSTMPSISTAAAATALYAVPAAILLFITFLALGRLITLRARADVLVDGHWLSALARAQRRMGFKHGTALLTSNELASPISWGLMRPVILLNNRAVEAADEAEAIIAHELAHVAHVDWVKLLLARIATALFWFNPLVWMLAREAHQLREETADDSVLAANIPDTDYAQLLVGVARHECPGMLLGAHGVAPSKSSLARRVSRVLDGTSVRGPAARSFAVGVLVGAILIATPLAALTVKPKGGAAAPAKTLAGGTPASSYYPGGDETDAGPADLPSIISSGVSTSVQTAMAAVSPTIMLKGHGSDFESVGPNGASVRQFNGTTVATGPNGATVTIYPAGKDGRQKVVARAPNGATTVTYQDADDDANAGHSRHNRPASIDRAIEARAVGVTPEYVQSIRAAAPYLASTLDDDDIIQMRAVGVTASYIQDLASAGLRNVGKDDLVQARAVGVNGNYVRSIYGAGFRGSLDDLVEMRAVGVTANDVVAALKMNGRKVDADEVIDVKTGGYDPPEPPAAPEPPRLHNR